MVLPVVELSIVRPMAGMPPQRLYDLTGTAVCGGGLPDLTFSLSNGRRISTKVYIRSSGGEI
jgi:hypothetical protein